jgi:hypothetical protein
LRLEVLRRRGLDVLNGEVAGLIGVPEEGERGLNPMREPMNWEKKDRFVGM